MSEENLNNEVQPEAAEAPVSADATTQVAPAETPVSEVPQEPAPAAETEEPQVIIQKERGFAHYVGLHSCACSTSASSFCRVSRLPSA